MSRRRPLTGVQQAGVKIALTLEALANTGRTATVGGGQGVIVDHAVEGKGSLLRVRYRVRVRRLGLVWCSADKISFA